MQTNVCGALTIIRVRLDAYNIRQLGISSVSSQRVVLLPQPFQIYACVLEWGFLVTYCILCVKPDHRYNGGEITQPQVNGWPV